MVIPFTTPDRYQDKAFQILSLVLLEKVFVHLLNIVGCFRLDADTIIYANFTVRSTSRTDLFKITYC